MRDEIEQSPARWFTDEWMQTLANRLGTEFGRTSPSGINVKLHSRGSALGWLFGVLKQTAVTWNSNVHFTKLWWRIYDGSGGWRSYSDHERRYHAFRTVAHEMYHAIDQRQTGWWKWLWRYVRAWRPIHITRGSAHPMERPAYEFADRVMQEIDYAP